MPFFHKILIANRGEIAIRVMRTCRELGIKTVAVYSQADRNALHVRYADESFLLGEAPSSESYLRMDKVLEACLHTGADAVHPGYGFLSENAVFARKLQENGIVLIGPSADAMDIMGSKIASKQAVEKYGVPLVPGINEAITDDNNALEIAKKIGFPVLVKASAGGGGKGMRVVKNEEDFLSALNTAKSEARSSFGDDSVFIEKYVDGPRHIEFQIMADNHGNICHLFERECSIQRRHQKLIEESPSVAILPELRKAMGDAAISVAKACNYSGAGTVEFLVGSDNNFYFLEMNTRLQVEHPVTECVTGIDLVKEQIAVAAGSPLSFSQEDLAINGHAIELRVCAEDPLNNFLPDVGKLDIYIKPSGPGIRVDDCMEPDMVIPMYYDNMIAKLIAHGKDRETAIARLRRAISEYQITGVKTTLAFGDFVLSHPKFIAGKFDTHFIAEEFIPENFIESKFTDTEEKGLAIAATNFFKSENSVAITPDKGLSVGQTSNWLTNRMDYNS